MVSTAIQISPGAVTRSGNTRSEVYPVERSPRPGRGRHPADLGSRRRCDRKLAPWCELDRLGSSLLAARLLVPAGMTTPGHQRILSNNSLEADLTWQPRGSESP